MVEHARHALIMGIGSFGDEDFHDLDFCDARTADLTEALGGLGYSCSSPAKLSSGDLGAAVQRALSEPDQDAAVVVHVLSHGCVSDRTSSLYVVGDDGCHGPQTKVDQWLACSADFPGPHVLFLLDLCHAGAAARLPWQLNTADSENRTWVIGAASSAQEAFNGRFTKAVSDVCRAIASGAMDTDVTVKYVPLPAVARAIDRRLRELRDQDAALHQEVTCTVIDMKHARDLELPFFPNVHYRDKPLRRIRRSVDPAVATFVDELDEALDVDHFLARASGHGSFTEAPVTGMFRGRSEQLRVLSEWMDDPGGDSLRVVTGGPGVGKSALLGVLLCAAHPVLSEPTHHLWSRASHTPSVQDQLAAVHMRQRDLDEVLASLARQLSLDVSTAPDLIEALRGLADPPVVMLDALDEAVQPSAIQTVLLLPLARARRDDGRSVVRLLVGVRPWEEFAPLRSAGAVVDLDDVPRSVISADLRGYAEDVLRAQPNYRSVGQREVRKVLAAALAERLTQPRDDSPRWGEFLVAGLFLHHLSATDVAMDVDTARVLGLGAPLSLPEVMELELSIAAAGDRIREVLTVLSHALGEGMPASLIGPDVRAVLAEARFYLRHSVDSDGVTLYRLFHQGLADYLKAQSSADFAVRLFDRMYATASELWRSAEPYLLRHMAAHAVQAGRLDQVLSDAEFLVHAEPVGLLRELDHAESDGARLAAAVYRRSAGHHARRLPQARRQILMMDAARYGHEQLLTDLARSQDMSPRWCTGSQAAPQLRATLTGHEDSVSAVDCTTLNGRPVAVSASEDRTLRVWDLISGHPIGMPLVGHTGGVNAVRCIVLEGRPVAVSVSSDCSVRIWDITDGQPVGKPMVGHDDSVLALTCVELGGEPIAVTAGEDRVRVWSLTERTELWHSNYLRGWVWAVACATVDGQERVIAGGDANLVWQWDLRTGVMVGHPIVVGEPDHRDGVRPSVKNFVSVIRPVTTGESTRAIIGKSDGMIQVWDLATGQPVSEEVRAHRETVLGIDLIEWGGVSIVVTVGDDGVRFWRWPSLRAHATWLTGHDEWVLTITHVPVDTRLTLITGGGDMSIRLWDAPDTRDSLGYRLRGADEYLQHVRVVRVNERDVVVGAGNDRTVRQWDLRTGRAVGQPYTGHRDRIYGLAVAELDQMPLALTASEDNSVRIWDVASSEMICSPLVGNAERLSTVATVVVDGRLLAAAGGDGVVDVWDISGGRFIRSIDDSWRAAIYSLDCVLVDGRPLVVTGNSQGAVQVYDLLTGDSVDGQLGAAANAVRVVRCVERDGQVIAVVGLEDGGLMTWDLTSRALLGSRAAEREHATSDVAFTDVDGDVAIISAGRRRLTWWRTDLVEPFREVVLPASPKSVAVGSNGEIVVAMGWEVAVISPTGQDV